MSDWDELARLAEQERQGLALFAEAQNRAAEIEERRKAEAHAELYADLTAKMQALSEQTAQQADWSAMLNVVPKTGAGDLADVVEETRARLRQVLGVGPDLI